MKADFFTLRHDTQLSDSLSMARGRARGEERAGEERAGEEGIATKSTKISKGDHKIICEFCAFLWLVPFDAFEFDGPLRHDNPEDFLKSLSEPSKLLPCWTTPTKLF
jgi:hypothetical protein